jgi:predicted DNA-binding transcriptional regulator YafY
MSAVGKIRRLLNLLEHLQTGRVWSTADLMAACQVSRRTVFRDLKALQEAGVPVLYDAARQGYWLPSDKYLPPTQLSLSETLALITLSLEAGRSERSIPFLEGAREAALKLQSTLPARLSGYSNELMSSLKIDTEPLAQPREGRAHWRNALESLTSRKKLRIHYRSFFEEKDIHTLLSPYQVLFRRHAWYVIGRSSLHRSVRTFHIERILQSSLTEDDYVIPPRFSLKQYLGHAWNMIREKNARTQVKVHFQRLVARNVAEVNWHPTQKIVTYEDESIDYSVTVDGIHEISWWILSYGDQAEVLEPPELRALIADRIRNMAAMYRKKRK